MCIGITSMDVVLVLYFGIYLYPEERCRTI